MKLELRLLVFNLISNLVTTVLKVTGGLIFGMSSLVADGFHTFTDFVSDIITIIGLKLSRKKPTKENPWGFGRVQYLTNLFIGIILFLLGIALIIICFFLEIKIPDIKVLYILILAIFIKSTSLLYLEKKARKLKTQTLVVSIEESKSDLIASICIVGIVIMLQLSHYISILKYFDLIGGLILSYLVAAAGFKIVKENALNLLGTVETDEDKITIIKNIIKNISDVQVDNIELIKYGAYYKVHFVLILNPKLTLREIQLLENKIIFALKRSKKINVKHINIDVDPYKQERK